MTGRCLTATCSMRCANQALGLGPSGDDQERGIMSGIFKVALFPAALLEGAAFLL